ncbi:MAG: hypothetical protein AAFQ82_26955 [Myxococcota bacterium]
MPLSLGIGNQSYDGLDENEVGVDIDTVIFDDLTLNNPQRFSLLNSSVDHNDISQDSVGVCII